MSEIIVPSSLAIICQILDNYKPRNFEIVLWNGSILPAESGETKTFTLYINHPRVVKDMFLNPTMLSLGEAYLNQGFDITGDFDAAFQLAEYLANCRLPILKRLFFQLRFLTTPKNCHLLNGRKPLELDGGLGSPKRARLAVNFHYDIPNTFWTLLLDEYMQYTCGYFQSPTDALEKAQESKINYICRKLNLKPGERMLDLGCGWGGLLIYCAKFYGTNIVGVTLGKHQAEFARVRVKELGLDSQCKVVMMDFREIRSLGKFDKIAGIGILEHIGNSNLREYFSAVWDCLNPGGLFLNQAISSNPQKPLPGTFEFMDKYVFPDTRLISIGQLLAASENIGFEVIDVESLGNHYELTLVKWLERIRVNRNDICGLLNESTYRAFEISFEGAKRYFKLGHLNIYQTLWGKFDGKLPQTPLTRNHLYNKNLHESLL